MVWEGWKKPENTDKTNIYTGRTYTHSQKPKLMIEPAMQHPDRSYFCLLDYVNATISDDNKMFDAVY